MSKKLIRLTESYLHNIINESIKEILTESQESKSEHQAVRLVMNKFGYDKEQAYEFVHKTIRQDIDALKDKELGKFILGVTRMCCDGELNDASKINNLNSTLKLMKAHINEYDRNLNGMSAQELISRFKKVRNNKLKTEKDEINQMTFGESNYRIVPINSFEEAKQYYKYTYSESPWCLTHMKDMFDSYTKNGINQIYFCFRNGFENIKPIVGEGCPLDDYGLSMISVIVNENGELVYCTSRWNHKNGGNDSVMNAKEVSEVVGVNFYQVFKPNNKWAELLDSVNQRIANGEPLENIFDKCGIFINGFARVVLNRKMNFITQDGKILSKKWFDNVYDFRTNGFARVILKDKWNYISQDGKFLYRRWFDYVYDFENGFGIVVLNGKMNYISQDGKILSKKWFDRCYGFGSNGFGVVELNGKRYFINTNGEKIFNNNQKIS